ncbi:uncharacterized protein B0H64DRAFT_314661 [Chaetomium fimeti]|uniref:Uncharacterized protein n=1 Tax=Chaetomium fimeti TaxID=1854472 RepID=A0AAE0LXJ3_9PEZI|nr:hypothetical protein B0H64DRAFT_314661 [Chaetomium fimeti]
MSSSTYTFYPPGPDTEQPRNTSPQLPQYLNPFSPQLDSSSSSPGLNAHTPADSVSTLSVHYQSSEFTEADDPFFGVSFNPLDGGASPSFLDDDILTFNDNGPLADGLGVQAAPVSTQHVRPAVPYLPLSPDKSPSLPGGSPNGQFKDEAATRGMFPDLIRTSVSPQDLSLTHQSSHGQEGNPSGFQLTPKTSNSAKSSDDGTVPTAAMRSPRVTVSHWDRDYFGGSHAPNTNQPQGSGTPTFSTDRDAAGRWIPNQVTGQGGLDPTARSTTQVESINNLAAQRDRDERNEGVNEWLKRSRSHSTPNRGEQLPATLNAPIAPNDDDDDDDNIPQREISAGDRTENKQVPGQTYYVETGGALTHEDLEIMRQARVWEDAPSPFSISQSSSTAYQPQSSQAAIEKYQQMCRDTDSIVSRAATWGTRRLSLPSIMDADVQVAGNLFKKLSLSRGDTRRPSLLQNIRGLVRKPSINSGKRNRAEPDDASSFVTVSSIEKKDSQTKLAPPSPKPGWSRKQSVPSINTAFLDVGNRIASLGTNHGRTSSASATPVTSPKSPSGFNLSVKKPLNRLRSKSETSGIIDLWKRAGGPPVPNTKATAPDDEDEDDEDDLYEDGDMKDESNKLMDGITPNLAGFQQHVLKLNPLLATSNNYLVERIAHQQCHRYKNLLNLRVKHLQAVAARNCSCGSMCIAMGGSANILDSKGGERGLDPLSARYDGSDGDITPLEGTINPDSFPQDIPMPPFPPTFPAKSDQHHSFGSQSGMPHGPMSRQPGPMAYPQQAPPLGMYPIAPPSQGYPTGNLYSPNFDGLSHGIGQGQINMSPMAHHHQHQNQLHNQHQHHGFQSLNSQAAFSNLPVTSSAGAYMSAPQASPNYMPMASDLEPFPALDMDVLGLGLQNPTGAAGQMPYGGGGGGLIDPNLGLGVEQQHTQQQQQQQHQHQQQQFTPQGSVSPFVRSPHAPQGDFYP